MSGWQNGDAKPGFKLKGLVKTVSFLWHFALGNRHS